MPDGYSFCPHCGNPFVRSDNASISPYDYEECVAEYLKQSGYKNVYTTKKSGDYGADVIGISPKGERVCVQCKKYNSPVGVKAVQEIYSAKAYYKCELAYVVTTSSFTPQAQELAAKTGVRLFTFVPDASSLPKGKHLVQKSYGGTASRSKNTSKSSHNYGLLILFLALVACVIFTGVSLKNSEAKKQKLRESTIASAVNKDEDPSATISDQQNKGSGKSVSVIVDGVCYFLNNDHLEVFCLSDVKKTSISIREEIDGIPVTVIRTEAFCNEKNIISVTLPSSVTEIRTSAFSGCTELATINLPDRLTEISQNAFRSCTSLQSISIPSSVISIKPEAFCNTGLSTISLESVEEIGRSAFADCNLSSIYLSHTLKTIGDGAFHNNRMLQSIIIPEGVTYVGDECFLNCEGLKSISLPESLTGIGVRCFDGCKALTEIKIPPNVERLSGSRMFYGDISLENIYVPANCKIPNGNNPFDGCNARIVFY